MYSIRNIIDRFLKKYGLTIENEPVLVGFSGGADSLCLLDNLHKLGVNLVAIHLNHNWRAEQSFQDCEFCKIFCEQRNIPFYTEILPDNIPHTETAAREARYDFFNRAAKKYNSKIVFTAHNADDNAETVLYRIIKGTGTEGLGAIAEHRGIFYRPLLNITREEIEEYCSDNHLNPNIDSSNSNTAYRRNFIRHKILPLMKEINPNTISALNSLSRIAEEENEILNDYIRQISNDTKNSTQKFLTLSTAVQNRIIYNLFRENNLDYDRETILKTINFIKENSTSKAGKTLSITNDLWLFAGSELFEFITHSPKNSTFIEITEPGEYEFDDNIFSIQKCGDLPEKFPKDSDFTAYVKINEINLTLRYRKDGDIIRPLGSAGTQKLKKYLNSKKIPNHKKNSIPLLCKNNEVLWVAGYGLNEKIKIPSAQITGSDHYTFDNHSQDIENNNIYMIKLTHKNEVDYGN